jgi:uncharacterized membrane protein
VKAPLRGLLALFYGAAGIVHLLWPDIFLPVMPEIVPFPVTVILLTGLCEIAGAIGLMLPRWRRLAGLMLAVYAICVFPANIRHAMIGGELWGWPLDWRYHAPRLLFQLVLVWWALWAGGWINDPLAD